MADGGIFADLIPRDDGADDGALSAAPRPGGDFADLIPKTQPKPAAAAPRAAHAPGGAFADQQAEPWNRPGVLDPNNVGPADQKLTDDITALNGPAPPQPKVPLTGEAADIAAGGMPMTAGPGGAGLIAGIQKALGGTQLPDPSKPQDTPWEHFKKIMGNVAETQKKVAGGLMEAAGNVEGAPLAYDTPEMKAFSDLQPDHNLARNSKYLKPGVSTQTDFRTKLSPEAEKKFQAYLKDHSDPKDLGRADGADYDMRGWWAAAQRGDPRATLITSPDDGLKHRSDWWKTPYHQSFSVDSQWANHDAPRWHGSQLVDSTGAVVHDDAAPPADDTPEAQKAAMRELGAKIANKATAHIKANMPNVPGASIQGVAGEVVSGIANMVPLMAASMVTKSAAPVLIGFGVQGFGEKYAESIAAGRTPEEAKGDAVFSAAAVSLPATLPVHAIMKPGQKFLGKAFATAFSASAQTILTTAMEMGYAKGVLKENMTWGEAWPVLAKSGIIGFATGLGLAGATHPIEALTARAGAQPIEPVEKPGTKDATNITEIIPAAKPAVNGKKPTVPDAVANPVAAPQAVHDPVTWAQTGWKLPSGETVALDDPRATAPAPADKPFTTTPGAIAAEHAAEVSAIEAQGTRAADPVVKAAKEALASNIDPETGAKPKGARALREFRGRMQTIIAGESESRHAVEPNVSRGSDENVQQVPKSEAAKAGVLPGASERVYANTSQNGRGAKSAGPGAPDSSVLAGQRKAGKGTVSDMRGSGSPDASSQLSGTDQDNLAVRKLPSALPQGDKGSGQAGPGNTGPGGIQRVVRQKVAGTSGTPAIKTNKVRGAPRQIEKDADHAAAILGRSGGIRNDEGHDLVKGRGLQQMIPGVGPLIRPKGMSVDAAGEVLWNEGYFGPPDKSPRPTENDVLQLLERTRRGADNKPVKVYRPERAAELEQASTGAKAEEDNATARADIAKYAKSYGQDYSPEVVDQIMGHMGEHGIDHETAVNEHMERAALESHGELRQIIGHDQFEDVPFDTAAPEVRPAEDGRAVGEGRGAPEGAASDEGKGAAVRESDARVEPEAERGETGLDQTIVPGTARSARQLAQAREAAGKGRMKSKAEQKDAGGMFEDKSQQTKDMFDQPAPAKKLKYDPAELAPAVEEYRALRDTDKRLSQRAHELEEVSRALVKTGPTDKHAEANTKARAARKESNDHFDKIDAMAKKWGDKGVDLDAEIEKKPAAKADEVFEGKDGEDIPFARRQKIDPKAEHPTETPEFKRWFGGSKVVDKDGKPVRVYHGTQRPDRIGNRFRKNRATSGPMSFFTEDPELASSYATGKQDTSLYNEDQNYETWFKAKVPGQRTRVSVDRMWWHLSQEERQKVADLAPRVGRDDEGNIMLHHEGEKRGLGGYDQHIKEARGNHLKALVDEWLNSGALFNDEGEFSKVLKLAGVERKFEEDFPHAQYPAVIPTYLSIKNPLDTTAIPKGVVDALNKAARRQRRAPDAHGADIWAKNSRSARDWMDTLHEGIAKPDSNHAFTSVPDWVTETLKGLGYDGIKDVGGKLSNGKRHNVWIPFEETQVKSAVGNRGTFDPNKKRIDFSKGSDKAPAGWDSVGGDHPGAHISRAARGQVKAHTRFTPEFDAQRAELTKILRKRLNQIGLTDIALKVPDWIKAVGENQSQEFGSYADGFYSPLKRLIAVAIDSKKGWENAIDHESIHALRDLGLINDKEWAILSKKAGEWAKKYDIEKTYAPIRAEKVIEEAIAHAFPDFVAGKLGNAGGAVNRIFRKISNFFEAARNALDGLGFKSADDIFRDIDSGKIGNRDTPDRMAMPAEPSFARRPKQEEESREPLFDKLSTDPNPSVMEALADRDHGLVERLKGAASPTAIQESMDRWRTGFQDRFLPLLRVQDAIEIQTGHKLEESENPYLAEELSAGRKGAKLEDLDQNHIRPLMEGLHETGVSIPELEAYLYARHAPERNARIAKINPEFRGDLLKDAGAGSGMTDAEAAQIMAAAKDSGKLDNLKALAKQVDAILSNAMKERVDAGLLSQADADIWRNTYKEYVPLRGDPFADPEMGSDKPNAGQGINVKGRESQMAFGRKTKARDILAYTIMQAEEAIIRAEKNRVAKAFLDLAKTSENEDFWKVDKISQRKVFDKRTGEVRSEATDKISAEDKDYTVSAKVDGVEHRVTMNRNNPSARRLAESMRSLNEEQLQFVVRTLGSVTRFLSSVNTSFNPEFVISNAFRDLEEATFNLQKNGIKGLTRGVLKDYLPALKASLGHEFGKDAGEWGKWAKEFRAQGGKVYFNKADDIAVQRTKLEKAFRDAKPGITARKAIHSLFGLIEHVNGGVENGVRLAAYKNAREAGMSAARAASLAKNLTINFNRRGSYGPLINSMYMFYNAGVQGTATMLTALKSPAVRRLAYAAVATGAALEVLNSMTSQKDKDGELFYDKISDFDKSRNLVLMDPTSDKGRYFKVPLPYGYSSFFHIGRAGIELYRGKRATDIGSSLVGSIVDAFNPIGGTNSILNFVAPTIIDPVVDLVRNRDYADRPIMPDQNQFGPEKPENQRYWNNVSPIAKGVTDTLNTATGGDEVMPGTIDLSPEVLEYMFGQVTGAAGSFYLRSADLFKKMVDPAAELSWNDIPMARKLVGAPNKSIDKSLFYDRAARVEQQFFYVKGYIRNGGSAIARASADQKRDVLILAKTAMKSQEVLSKVNRAKAQAKLQYDKGKLSRDAYADRIKDLEETADKVISSFNKLYIEKGLEPGQMPNKPKVEPERHSEAGPADLKGALRSGDLTRFAAAGASWTRQEAIQAASGAGLSATAAALRDTPGPVRPRQYQKFVGETATG